jgi:CDP-6-deoxy-D-xylo-4-hexulose-3-dehydrase
LNPIIQNGLTPVFVDVDLQTYNATLESITEAISPKTKAIFLAHTLGNPFAVSEVQDLAKDRELWLVEDCCDALGSEYNGQKAGTFGDLATFSFYPAHHITMGEGGAVVTNSSELAKLVTSLRDWGRDCYCPPGKDNTCGRRFKGKYGGLPDGYDHKYVYSNAGYNLKITDMQAAIGLAQMSHLDDFIKKRKANFRRLRKNLIAVENHLQLPEKTSGSEPSWFGFPITIRDSKKFNRVRLLEHLNKAKIGTRLLFGGNLIKQPYMDSVKYRVSGPLNNTDRIMDDSFWIGVYPGLTSEMLDYVSNVLVKYFEAD